MGWLTSAALRESKLLKKLLGLSSYQLDNNGNVIGFLDASGMPMASKAVPWAEFITLGSGDVQDRSAVWVYDKQCMFVWNDLAARWYLVGGRLTFATFDLLPLPSANINGLRAWVESGIGIGGAWVEVRLIGSDYLWRYTAGRAVIDATTSDILHTTAFNVEKLIRSKLLPRNNGKCIMQNGDILAIRSVAARTAYVTNLTRYFKFGALNTTSDTLIESLPGGTTHTIPEYNEIMRVSATALYLVGPNSGNKWAGSSGSDTIADTTVTNMDSNDCYFHYTLNQSASTDEGVKLKKGYRLELIHTGG